MAIKPARSHREGSARRPRARKGATHAAVDAARGEGTVPLARRGEDRREGGPPHRGRLLLAHKAHEPRTRHTRGGLMWATI